MKNSTTAIGLALGAAGIGFALWALGPGEAPAAPVEAEFREVAAESVRPERTLEVAAAPRETKAAPAAKAKDYIPATDYARPEDVPWEVFKNKKFALTLRPNRILEDGTIEYVDVPMLQKGKRVFGTMSAKPTEVAAILPDEIPEGQVDTSAASSASAGPVGIPTPQGATPPPPRTPQRN
jgi:hypothetical protein